MLTQKRARVEASHLIFAGFEKDVDFLSHIVTMYATWVHFYDQKTKQQLIEWRHPGSPRLETLQFFKTLDVCDQKSAAKVLASVLWDYHRVIRVEQ